MENMEEKIDELEDQNIALDRELERVNDEFNYEKANRIKHQGMWLDCQRKVQELEAQLKDWETRCPTQHAYNQRTAQLKKHGGHTADCACHGGYYTQPGGGNFTANPCDCGWAKIEKGLG